MMKKNNILTMLLCLLTLIASANGQKAEFAMSGSDVPGSRVEAADPEYVIGALDILHVAVWKEPELTVNVPVRPDGRISLPLLNDVKAAGLTPNQLQQNLTERFRKFLTGAQVSVTLTAINSKRFFVVGEVAHPGGFTLLPGTTALQAISMAGGLTPFANTKKITILRSGNDGARTRIPFDYKAALRGEERAGDIVLSPGDTVAVR